MRTMRRYLASQAPHLDLRHPAQLHPAVEPSDLLPSDKNSEWAKLNPSGKGDLADVNLLQAGHHSGINTVAGQAMRNSNLQLRSDPPVNKESVGPWNNSTIEADTSRLQFEIGSTI